ncbi:MFS transporter [Azospirillum sp. ST 5-10]|uniref:MFS transporter n=1 Tax=unclassified Azospirillum TaxID=2630922 RepID=UPI003F4A80FF
MESVRLQLTVSFALVAGGAALLACAAPAVLDAADRTPLRRLGLATAAAGAFTVAALAVFAAVPGATVGRETAYDAVVVLLVSMLALFEALRLRGPGAPVRPAVVPGGGAAGGGAADGGLAGVRVTLFLFMLAEELSRSFLPLYVRELYTPVAGLSETLVMGLPIALFMLLVAVFTPFAGAWADRFGCRRTLLLGALPAVAGFLGTALAQSLAELLLWRGACALGYAVMFIGAQGFVARHSGRGERARGMAQFVAAVIVAGLCGAAMGGILADHLGFRATFAVSALLALAAAGAAALLLPPEAPDRGEAPAGGLRHGAAVLANPRFLALLLFSSVPTKLMLTGSLFYLVPVALHALGETPAAIGRTMMCYGLLIVVLGPAVSRAADRGGRHALFAGAGGLIAGAGALAVLVAPGVPAVLLGVAALGVGHALNNATQLALVPEVCRAECARLGSTTVFAVYRLLERGGSVLGPLLAAAVADRFGPQAALAALGGVGLAAGAAFCAVFVLTVPPAAPAVVGAGAGGEGAP